MMAEQVKAEPNNVDNGPEATGKKKSTRERLRSDPKFRRWIKGLALAGAIAAVVGLIWIYEYYSVRESTDDAQIDGHINPISPRVGGTVIEVLVEENRYVKEGTVLVRLDPKDYQVALERAKADLAEAEAAAKAARTQVPVTSTSSSNRISSSEAALTKAQGGVEVAATQVETAQARLALMKARAREAQATYTKAAKDLERVKQLVEKDEISRQEYDGAVAAAETSSAARDSAEAAVRESEKEVDAAKARLDQARETVAEARAALATAHTGPQQTAITRQNANSAAARVEIARAEVERAKLNLDYTRIAAPVSGVITQKSVEVGQVIQPGQPLLAIVPLDDIWVRANFKETQLKNMHPGQKAEISVDAYDRTYEGYVESISAATGARTSLLPPENATGNYVKVVQRIPVRIRFEKGQDPKHLLRPGMSVVPTVFTR
jgi:membrane fusion protein (multidrug efflux system)